MAISEAVPQDYRELKAAAERLQSLEHRSQAISLLELWKQEASLRTKFGAAHNKWMRQLFPSGAHVQDLTPGELRLVPICVTTQHAVGHGGFHTGALGLGVPELRWIYDCGSWRKSGKEALDETIRRYAESISAAGPRANR